MSDDLPFGWEAKQNFEGRTYFINHLAETTTWDDPRKQRASSPANPHRRHTILHRLGALNGAPAVSTLNAPSKKEELPYGWEEKQTANGSTYYIDHITQTTTWDDPRTKKADLPADVYYAIPFQNKYKTVHHGYYINPTPVELTFTTHEIYTISLTASKKTTTNIPPSNALKSCVTSITTLGKIISITNTYNNQSITTVIRAQVKKPGDRSDLTRDRLIDLDSRLKLKKVLCCHCKSPNKLSCICIICTRHPSNSYPCRASHREGYEHIHQYHHLEDLNHTTRTDFFYLRSALDSELVLGLLSMWAGRSSIADHIWNMFLESWKHPPREFGKVNARAKHGISFYQPNPETVTRFENYVADCVKRDPHVNILPLWHGTTIACSGRDCLKFETCASCNIMTRGFHNKKIGRPTWERYGTGMYFASNSSKAHTYVNVGTTRKPKPNRDGKFTIILSLVALGRVYETESNDLSHLKGSPQNFDSLHGLVKKKRISDKDLRFDEYVVYNEAAVIPVATVEYEVQF